MTATPHNGEEEDFQLFLSLLDSDRFYGKFRDGVHKVDCSDLIRRMVKEKLVKFDGTPLFPERRAYTVNYNLSDLEAALYEAVTSYVKAEMGKADEVEGKRKGSLGFALTALQRRLASSPEAIFQSLKRRRERLERRLREERIGARGQQILAQTLANVPEDDDDLNAEEQENLEESLIDQATASQSLAELAAEISILQVLEQQAKTLVASGKDRKWDELSRILQNEPQMHDADKKANLEVAGQKLLLLLRRSFAILLAMAALFIGLGLLLSPPKEVAVVIVLLVFSCAFLFGALTLWPHASHYIASTSIEARLGKFAEASWTRPIERVHRLETRNEHLQPNPLSFREQIELPTLSELILALNDFGHQGGPATENQRAAVERLGLGEPPINLSFEQAHALLSARNYVRGVLYRVGQSPDRENWHHFETTLLPLWQKTPFFSRGPLPGATAVSHAAEERYQPPSETNIGTRLLSKPNGY